MKHISISALLLAGSQLAAQSPAIQQEKTNVLMILVDDLSTLLNCYGHEQVISPHIDELAGRGRMFERAYCQSAVCNPSRASFMTGKYPHELGIWTNQPHFRGFFPKIKTISEHFMDHGYYSVGIGKVFHNWGQSIQGDPQSWSEPQRYHYAAHFHDWYVPGRPYQLHFDLAKGPAVQCEDVPDEAYLDGRIANEAINKLRELQETPFFMAVGFWKPHLPFNAPKKYWDLYDRKDFSEVRYPEWVEGVPSIAYNQSREARTYTDVPNSGEISEEKKLELRHGYFASITYLDAQIGKLLTEFDRLGLSQNTVVVFFSDHGFHAGEFGEFGKLTNFEAGTRVPLIIAYPGMPYAGMSTAALTELVDIYPTLVDLCGLPSPAAGGQLSGNSLRPILDNPAEKGKEAALSQISRPLGVEQDFGILGSSIRTDTHRYNVWVQKSDGSIVAEELYDLSSDPNIVENIVQDRKRKSVRESLFLQLMQKFH
jgi:iduronate 2-sulfatase